MFYNNMVFPQLKLNPSYDSEDDVLYSFYNPVLSQAVSYYRLAGFFSSSALAVAARGMSNFLINNGKMKLLVGAQLQKKDVEVIQQGLEEPEKLIEKICLQDLYSINDEFITDHVSALGWMVANKTLEIKVAIVTDDTGIPLDADTISSQFFIQSQPYIKYHQLYKCIDILDVCEISSCFGNISAPEIHI